MSLKDGVRQISNKKANVVPNPADREGDPPRLLPSRFNSFAATMTADRWDGELNRLLIEKPEAACDARLFLHWRRGFMGTVRR